MVKQFEIVILFQYKLHTLRKERTFNNFFYELSTYFSHRDDVLNYFYIISMHLYDIYFVFTPIGQGPGAVAKAVCLESWRSQVRNPLRPQGSNFKLCVWRAVSSHSSHHPHEIILAQFSLHVHKCGLNPQ